MNMTANPRSVSRTFDLAFDEFPTTAGFVWSSADQRDRQFEIESFHDVTYSVNEFTNVAEIPINLYLDARVRPIRKGGGTGPVDFITLSARDLGPELADAVRAQIRSMMAADQNSLREANVCA